MEGGQSQVVKGVQVVEVVRVVGEGWSWFFRVVRVVQVGRVVQMVHVIK